MTPDKAIAVAAYLLVGVFVARRVGWWVYENLEKRLDDWDGGEYRPGGEDSPGYLLTSPWHYARMYLLPILAGVFWLPAAAAVAAWAGIAFILWLISSSYMKLLHPAVKWFFMPPGKR
jgi:hypothetical protein